MAVDSPAGPAAEAGDPMSREVFVARFPDDAACHRWLKERFYPDGTACPGCGRASKFHPIRGRSAYSCQFCGTHVYPTAGTVFHKSTTSLRLWFWAIFLIASTRGRITVRELERELGVSYGTAGRMLTQLRPRLDLENQWAAGRQDPSPAPAPRARAWHGSRRRA